MTHSRHHQATTCRNGLLEESAGLLGDGSARRGAAGESHRSDFGGLDEGSDPRGADEERPEDVAWKAGVVKEALDGQDGPGPYFPRIQSKMARLSARM